MFRRWHKCAIIIRHARSTTNCSLEILDHDDHFSSSVLTQYSFVGLQEMLELNECTISSYGDKPSKQKIAPS
jgi:hypothetical protein